MICQVCGVVGCTGSTGNMAVGMCESSVIIMDNDVIPVSTESMRLCHSALVNGELN